MLLLSCGASHYFSMAMYYEDGAAHSRNKIVLIVDVSKISETS